MMDTQTEEFRPVPGFPDYEVSNLGRVRSWKINATGKRGGFLKPSPQRKGYLRLDLWNVNGRTKFFIHKLVLLAFVGVAPDGSVTRHLDGDPTNNKLWNLTYGTQRENCADKVRHGTTNRGVKHNRSKLTPFDVVTIRECWEEMEWTLEEIGQAFGVYLSTIHNIIKRKTWAHIQ